MKQVTIKITCDEDYVTQALRSIANTYERESKTWPYAPIVAVGGNKHMSGAMFKYEEK